MKYEYYIQKGTDASKNIWDDYGVYVQKTEGLIDMPTSKKIFSRSWPDEQGLDSYIPTNAKFEEREITIWFAVAKDTVTDVKSTITEFRNYLLDGGDFSYFDTFKKEGFRGYYDKSKTKMEYYRETQAVVEFSLNFISPNGICYGFDNSSQSIIFVEIDEGYADVYFSDGFQVLNATEIFLYNLDGGFAIVCPSILGKTQILPRVNKVLGIGGKVLGINGKVLGI